MLHVRDASKTFHSGADRVRALDRVNLVLEEGEFVTVIGSNGAGKSTLLNLVAGTETPTQGRILLDGRDITTLAAHHRARFIGRIVQDPLAGTAPRLTVAENLALSWKRHRLRPALSRPRRRECYLRLAALGIGLETRMDCQVALLSGGERQALSVLMAMSLPPRILLLDEHTAALDPMNARMVIALTETFVAQSKVSTLMVTHNMEQAIAVGHRLIMMHSGKIVHEVDGEQKRRATVEGLVSLFTQRHIADDELLLSPVAQTTGCT